MIPETDIEIGSSLSYVRHLPTGIEVEHGARHSQNLAMAYDHMVRELDQKVTAAVQKPGATEVDGR